MPKVTKKMKLYPYIKKYITSKIDPKVLNNFIQIKDSNLDCEGKAGASSLTMELMQQNTQIMKGAWKKINEGEKKEH